MESELSTWADDGGPDLSGYDDIVLTPDEAHYADQDGERDLRHELLHVLHPTGYRDLRALHKTESPKTFGFNADNITGVDEFADKYRDRNVYLGVASRIDAKQRGLDGCLALYALFADQDYKDSSEAEARAKLEAFPLPPSAVVSSGGGLQSYWFLTEPLDLQNDAATAKRLLRALATALDADMAAAEPARILRLPDTRNYKYNPPRPVVIERLIAERRYTVAALESILPTIAEPKSEPLPSSVAEGDRNETLFREGCRLRRLGWSEAEIVAALGVLNTERCHPPLDSAEVQDIAHSCARYEPAADTFPTTETGDAEFFTTCNADTARYDHLAKRWLFFHEHYWVEQKTGNVHRLALDAIRARQRAAIGNTARLKWATGGEARNRQTNLLALAQNIKPIADAGDSWDLDPHLFGVQNGVIDLRNGVLRNGHPDDRITIVSPLTYDPRISTKTWEQFILAVSNNNQELADYFQVVFGYAMTGLTGEQCFWIFYGLGANGKSTLLEIITKYVMPSHSWTMKFPSTKWSDSLSDYQKAQLVGRRLVVSRENERTQRLNTEFIKSVTGDEKIDARHPYGRPFNFQPVSKEVLAVNHKPIIMDGTHAMWRRVRMVPFLRTFPLDRDFADRLAANEAGAALTWAVRGAVRYYAKGFTTPAIVLDATAKYQKDSDSLAPFFEERCVLETDKQVRAQHLFMALRDFYDKRLTPGDERLSQNEFGQRIANDSRFTVKNGTGKERRAVFYHGIGLVNVEGDL